MKRYEVFRPTTGLMIYATRYALVARIVSRLLNNRFEGGLDWSLSGEGWV